MEFIDAIKEENNKFVFDGEIFKNKFFEYALKYYQAIEKFDYFTITNGTHILILSDEQINTMSGEELSSLRIKTVDLSIF